MQFLQMWTNIYCTVYRYILITRGPRTLALCLTAAARMTGNFLQTCIKNSLLQTKSIEIWVNSHIVPHYACYSLQVISADLYQKLVSKNLYQKKKFRSYSTP